MLFVRNFNFKLGKAISCSLFKQMNAKYMVLMDTCVPDTAVWLRCTVSTAVLIFSLMIPRLLDAAALVQRVDRTQAAACCTKSISVVFSKPFKERFDWCWHWQICCWIIRADKWLHRKNWSWPLVHGTMFQQVYLRDMTVWFKSAHLFD